MKSAKRYALLLVSTVLAWGSLPAGAHAVPAGNATDTTVAATRSDMRKASGSRPKALTKSGTKRFRVRPISIKVGPKLIIGKAGGKRSNGFLKWHRWSKNGAFGRATIWVDDGCMDCGEFKYVVYKGSVALIGSRKGRFRYLELRYPGMGGSVENYMLMRRNGKWVWSWPSP